MPANDLDEVLEDAELRMMQSAEVFQEALRTVRTGRASPGLVENLNVECYGGHSPLKQVAGVSAPEPRMLLIRPYDPTILDQITRAIELSDLGVMPQSDGKVVRVPIPPLSEEVRRQMTRQVSDKAEQARIAIRNVRRSAIKDVDRMKKDGSAPEDDCKRAKDKAQNLTKKYEGEVDDLEKKKSAEVMGEE
jgi:ribosome recycling factor